MIGIYLGAYKAYHGNYNIVYQDKYVLRDLGGCMLEVDLSNYDFVIATPPCNFWSKARGNLLSEYALETKDLLPGILDKLSLLDKPFIVENVKNYKRFYEHSVLPRDDLFVYPVGRHLYFSNVFFNPLIAGYKYDFKNINGHCRDLKNDRQGGDNVHNVIELFLEQIHL